jgi:hypothetical protein
MKKLIIIAFISMLSTMHTVVPNSKEPFSELIVADSSSVAHSDKKPFQSKMKELFFCKDENPEEYDGPKSVLSISTILIIAAMFGIVK